jgi:hypothetical protein
MLTKSELNRMATLMAKMEGTDFSTVASMFKQAQYGRQRAAAATFKIGDTVKFEAEGRIREAVVTKVNRKTVAVKENQGLGFAWRVSPSLLKKV